MLKIILGKQLLHDSTSAILNQPPEGPEPFQSTLETAIDVDTVLDPPAPRHCFVTSFPHYLNDFLEKLIDSDSRGETK